MSEAILKVSGLVRYFGARRTLLARLTGQERQSVRAVDDLSLEIARGETLALVGESGCGKSTVARCIAGLIEPTAGSVSFSGRRLQMIFQDPYASLDPRWRVFEIVAEPIRAYRLAETERALSARVDELLEQVGLAAADGQKYPHEFSGGQRQRISIARALASEPDFLICDEPTSSLDVSVQAQILNLMKDLQRSLALTYLFITHNLAVVYQIADRVGVMYLGKLVETQGVAELFAGPRHPYTRMLLDAVPRLDGRRDRRSNVVGDLPSASAPPPGCRFHPRCASAFEPCSLHEPVMIDGVACHADAIKRRAPTLGSN